ncbi:AAA-domain-containing protein [Xylariomycetidae sp. FL2044]|nr:AAA-domain-containing protein [Xylariomycetidae sp. FL2044]
MHALWRCASRSSLLIPQARHLFPISYCRSFHLHYSLRAPPNGTSGTGGPRDGGNGNKPEKEDGAAVDGEKKDENHNNHTEENLFGENGTTTNSDDGQGRRKTSNGSLKARTLRNRKAEELPPVQLPAFFSNTAVSSFESRRQGLPSSAYFERDELATLYMALASRDKEDDDGHLQLLDSDIVDLASRIDTLSATSPNLEHLMRCVHLSDEVVGRASLLATRMTPGDHGEEKPTDPEYGSLLPTSTDILSVMVKSKFLEHVFRSEAPVYYERLSAHRHGFSPADAYHPFLLSEIMASVRADLVIPPPQNIRSADVQRPATILHMQDSATSFTARALVLKVADTMEADVLHLKASDVAYIVGNYLGQDPARVPGTVSQMGYRVAEHSGRARKPAEWDDEEEKPNDLQQMSYTMIMPERLRKDGKKFSLSDLLTNGPTRAKNDELWEDMKINAAIEEMIHLAAPNADANRPFIVHVEDFHALYTDTESGATILGKIRKVVDDMWLEGRKVALIGSCFSSNAPRAHTAGVKELESRDKVVTLRLPPKLSTVFKHFYQRWEHRDFLRENDENIVRMLLSMIEPSADHAVLSNGRLGLDKSNSENIPSDWGRNILPLAEVYRIATAMIAGDYNVDKSFSGDEYRPDHVLTLERLENAAVRISEADKIKKELLVHGRERRKKLEYLEQKSAPPEEDNHEKRHLSGLVNAQDIRTTFNDVHAPKETIESVKMLTTLSLIRPEAFSYGVLATDRIPGCLLYGPPGTGKTLLAKAVAKESGANMIEVSGASINNMYVGESEKSVRALFRLAKKREPMVIFIDEADALLGARGRRDNGAKRETINQFLREWDGMDKTKAFIMVATNRPFDLDEAVLRRLPRRLLIDLPREADRAAILRIHLKDEVLDEASVNLDDLARRTPLYSGSDLKNLGVAAAMAAVKEEVERCDQPEKYEKRVLYGRHFDKALAEIAASVSEDMATLAAIRKFDERYGDAGARNRKRKGMGFEVVKQSERGDEGEGRVRKGSGGL